MSELNNANIDLAAPVKYQGRFVAMSKFVLNYLILTVLALTIFFLSLLGTSQPVAAHEQDALDRAISILDAKDFRREVFLLKTITTFRRTDNWINSLNADENAFAATNFPMGVITLYPDFFERTVDDTERAMILLHEIQHLQGKDENEAYTYVWKHRERLGWTQLSHGTTQSYVTIERQTREFSPELFTCSEHLWSDCTETRKPSTRIAGKPKSVHTIK
jgi:hypothetical protein